MKARTMVRISKALHALRISFKVALVALGIMGVADPGFFPGIPKPPESPDPF